MSNRQPPRRIRRGEYGSANNRIIIEDDDIVPGEVFDRYHLEAMNSPPILNPYPFLPSPNYSLPSVLLGRELGLVSPSYLNPNYISRGLDPWLQPPPIQIDDIEPYISQNPSTWYYDSSRSLTSGSNNPIIIH